MKRCADQDICGCEDARMRKCAAPIATGAEMYGDFEKAGMPVIQQLNRYNLHINQYIRTLINFRTLINESILRRP